MHMNGEDDTWESGAGRNRKEVVLGMGPVAWRGIRASGMVGPVVATTRGGRGFGWLGTVGTLAWRRCRYWGSGWGVVQRRWSEAA